MTLIRTVTFAWCDTCQETPPEGTSPDRWADRHARQPGHHTHCVTRPREPRDDR